MSQGLMTRFKRWVAGEDLEHDLYDEAFEMEQEQHPMFGHSHDDDLMMERREPMMMNKRQKRNNLRLVEQSEGAMNASSYNEVIVIEPASFEESLEIVEHLRNSKSVVLNLHMLDTIQSQRVVDFLSGATHAIDGHQQRIGDGVFIFTPANVNISSEQEKRATSFNADTIWK